MNATYDYFYQEMPTDSLEVDDIGNCCIEVNNDNADFYYLIIKTDLGVTKIVEYGPYKDGLSVKNLTYSYSEFDYNETRIDKIINKFINHPARAITQAQLVDVSEIEENLKTPMEYFYNE